MISFSFTQSLRAWGRPDFKALLKREIEALSYRELPLQQGLTMGSYALDKDIEAMILSVQELETCIQVKVGIFYKSIIAGCSCADDPTPIDECNEHCEVMLEINKQTAATTITLLTD